MAHREENTLCQIECIFSVLHKFAFSGSGEMFFILTSWGFFSLKMLLRKVLEYQKTKQSLRGVNV